MSDDEQVREELVGHLVEAFLHLYAEAVGTPGLTDHEVLERLAPVVGLLEADRPRIEACATSEHGAIFGAWVARLLGRFSTTEPPLSLERPRRSEKE